MDAARFHRFLYENSRTGFVLIERSDLGNGGPIDFVISEANPAFLRMANMQRDGLIGSRVSDLVPDLLPRIAAACGEAQESGGFARLELAFAERGLYYDAEVSIVEPGLFAVTIEDVSERKRMEGSLRDSEFFLRKSQDVGDLGSYYYDIGADNWISSKKLDELFGIDASFPRSSEGWAAVIHPEDRDDMMAYLLEHVVKGKNRFDREYRIRRIDDGEERWVHGTGELEFDSRGETSKMIGTIQDITRRKRMELSLRDSEFFLRKSQEVGDLGSYYYDIKGDNWISSKKLDEIFGIDAGFPKTSAGWSQIMHPEDREEMLKYLLEDVIKGRNRFDREYRIRRVGDGEDRWVHGLGELEFDAEGSTAKMIGTIQDITLRKKAEDDIRLLNAELEARVAARTEELVRANAELASTLNRLKESYEQNIRSEKLAALGQLTAGIAHEMNTPLGVILAADRQAEGFAEFLREALALRDALSEGERSFLDELLGYARAETADFDPAVLRLRRKAIVEGLRGCSIEGLGALAEKLSCFDPQPPIGSLVEASALPRFREIVELAYWVASFLKSRWIIRTSADKAATVVRALKNYSHQDYREEMVEADVIQDIETALTLLQNKIKLGVTVLRDFKPLPLVRCVPDKLAQVWVNLLDNAIQAMNYSGTLRISTATVKDWAVVRVGDDGPGIPEEIRGKIFEPFFTTKPRGEGSGLGLDICSRILGELGGRIEFTSVPGETVFSVYLRADGKATEGAA
jgi:PAS domain S-box-containing protein